MGALVKNPLATCLLMGTRGAGFTPEEPSKKPKDVLKDCPFRRCREGPSQDEQRFQFPFNR